MPKQQKHENDILKIRKKAKGNITTTNTTPKI